MMSAAGAPGGGFITRPSHCPVTQNATRHATRLRNEAGGATPGQKANLTSFLSSVRHKPIPSHSHATGNCEPNGPIGRRCSWHPNTTMPHTTKTTESLGKFFCLKAAPNRYAEHPAKIENSPENSSAAAAAVPVTLRNRVVGACTPHPVSHQCGVSGGGGNHRFTPDWCDHSSGVVTRA